MPDLRDRLAALSHREKPVFEPSDNPVLTAFAAMFADSALYAFDANKHLRTDALTPIYDCETESQPYQHAASERFTAVWSPVWTGTHLLTGFRTGRDSAWLGTTPTVTMPQDERTAALLLLVGSDFVHLSASTVDDKVVVQGAISTGGLGYRFVSLNPAARTVDIPPNRTRAGLGYHE